MLELYVDANAPGGGNGSRDLPWQSPVTARDYIRALKAGEGLPTGGVTVFLRGGTYTLSSTFALTSSDSGEATKPIVWRNYYGETVYLCGGRVLSAGSFAAITEGDPNWSKFPSGARSSILVYDLAGAGITDYGTLQPRGYAISPVAAMELFVDDEAYRLARWPNAGAWDTTATVPNGRWGSPYAFTTADNHVDAWEGQSGGFVCGFFYNGYAEDHRAVSSVVASTNTITLATQPSYGLGTGKKWFGYNFPQELDEAGEYWIDRTNGRLYVFPNGSLSGKRIVVSVLSTDMLTATSTAYVTLRGMTIEGGRARALALTSCTNLTVERCAIRNLGTDGIYISGGSNVTVQDGSILNTGDHGIEINAGDRATLTSCAHLIYNMEISYFSRFDLTNRPAVRVRGVGTTIRNCEIHHTSHQAIKLYGNNHLVEKCLIHHCMSTSTDGGVIYGGRDWGARGQVFQDNIIHSCDSDMGVNPWDVVAFYFDDCDSGKVIQRNVIYGVDGIGISIGGGRDNLIYNNIIQGVDWGVFADMRGTATILWDTGNATETSWDLEAKIIQWAYTSAPWSTAYPALAAILTEGGDRATQKANASLPKGNVAQRNCFYQRTDAFKAGTWGGTTPYDYWTRSNNLENSNPLMVDPSNGDFSLDPESPCLDIEGWEEIPVDEIGLLEIEEESAPPAAPTGVQAATGSNEGEIDLTWNAASGATSYKVYYDEEESAPPYAPSDDGSPASGSDVGNVTAKTITGLTPGATYYLAVCAVNAVGESLYSSEVSAAAKAPSAPAAPTGVTAATGVSGGQVDLSWNAASGATGYKIYYAESSGAPYSPSQNGTPANGANVGDVTGVTISGLTEGETYYFAVKAVGPGGASDYSSEDDAVVQTTPPAAPTGVSAVSGDAAGKIDLSWNAASGATGYKIYYAESSGAPYSPIQDGSPASGSDVGNVTGQTITGLTPGATYYLAVKAYNAGGDSGYSSEASAAALPNAPSAPTGVTATTGPLYGQITLAWAAASGATSYTIHYAEASGAPYEPSDDGTPASGSNVGNVTEVIVSDLAQGTLYYLAVKALNAGGASDYSAEESATAKDVPGPSVPDAPTDVVAATGDAAGEIDVSWAASAGADGYKVFYDEDPDNPPFVPTVGGSPASGADVGAVLEQTITGLTAGQLYYVAVVAYNVAGDSLFSAQSSATAGQAEDEGETTPSEHTVVEAPEGWWSEGDGPYGGAVDRAQDAGARIERMLVFDLGLGVLYPGKGFAFASTAGVSSPCAQAGDLPTSTFAGGEDGYISEVFGENAYGLGLASRRVGWRAAAGCTETEIALELEEGGDFLPEGFAEGLTARINGEDRVIASNTADTITLAEALSVAPAAGDLVLIGAMECAVAFSEARAERPVSVAGFEFDIHDAQLEEQEIEVEIRRAGAGRTSVDWSAAPGTRRRFWSRDIEAGRGCIHVRGESSRAVAYGVRFRPTGGGALVVGPARAIENIHGAERGRAR